MTSNITHLYVKGEPRVCEGLGNGRIADRNYACFARTDAKDDRDVNAWLHETSAMAGNQRGLMDLMRAGKAEALYWIAILGGEPLAMPQIDPSLVSIVESQNAQILLEKYTMKRKALKIPSNSSCQPSSRFRPLRKSAIESRPVFRHD